MLCSDGYVCRDSAPCWRCWDCLSLVSSCTQTHRQKHPLRRASEEGFSTRPWNAWRSDSVPPERLPQNTASSPGNHDRQLRPGNGAFCGLAVHIDSLGNMGKRIPPTDDGMVRSRRGIQKEQTPHDVRSLGLHPNFDTRDDCSKRVHRPGANRVQRMRLFPIKLMGKNRGMHPHRVQLLHAEVSVHPHRVQMHPVLVHFGDYDGVS